MRPAIGSDSLRRTQNIDSMLLTVVLVLTIIGLVTVYSASSERSMEQYGNPHSMFLKQLARAMIGLGIMVITAWIPFRTWKKLGFVAYFISLLMLILIFISKMGYESHGAHRWLVLGPLRFQPSELAKFSLVLFIATWAANKGERMSTLKQGLVIPLGMSFLIVLLVALQPDFSTAGMIAAIALVMVFVTGANIKYLAAFGIPVTAAGMLYVWFEPYRRERLMSYLQISIEPNDAKYQVLQSWIGFGRGWLFGVGPGESRQKLFFLPDAHTDFIYAIVGEEWGFIGATVVLLLFLVFIYRGFQAAIRCPDAFGAYLAFGLTFAIGFYAIVNMGIATGVLPTTGLPLPMISFGGTSLLLTYTAIGMILNVSQYGIKAPVKRMSRGIR